MDKFYLNHFFKDKEYIEQLDCLAFMIFTLIMTNDYYKNFRKILKPTRSNVVCKRVCYRLARYYFKAVCDGEGVSIYYYLDQIENKLDRGVKPYEDMFEELYWED